MLIIRFSMILGTSTYPLALGSRRRSKCSPYFLNDEPLILYFINGTHYSFNKKNPEFAIDCYYATLTAIMLH